MSVKKTFGGKGCSLYGEGNSGLDAVVLGKGPLVGRIMLASETTKEVVPIMPLEFGFRNWRKKGRGQLPAKMTDIIPLPRYILRFLIAVRLGCFFISSFLAMGFRRAAISGFHRSLASSSGFRLACCRPAFGMGEMPSFACDLYSNLYFPMDDPDGCFIDITITEYTDMNAIEDVIYEKDGTPVQEIAAGDRHIYIIENSGSNNVICNKDNIVCSVTGSEGVSQNILLRVLGSIRVIQ